MMAASSRRLSLHAPRSAFLSRLAPPLRLSRPAPAPGARGTRPQPPVRGADRPLCRPDGARRHPLGLRRDRRAAGAAAPCEPHPAALLPRLPGARDGGGRHLPPRLAASHSAALRGGDARHISRSGRSRADCRIRGLWAGAALARPPRAGRPRRLQARRDSPLLPLAATDGAGADRLGGDRYRRQPRPPACRRPSSPPRRR